MLAAFCHVLVVVKLLHPRECVCWLGATPCCPPHSRLYSQVGRWIGSSWGIKRSGPSLEPEGRGFRLGRDGKGMEMRFRLYKSSPLTTDI